MNTATHKRPVSANKTSSPKKTKFTGSIAAAMLASSIKKDARATTVSPAKKATRFSDHFGIGMEAPVRIAGSLVDYQTPVKSLKTSTSVKNVVKMSQVTSSLMQPTLSKMNQLAVKGLAEPINYDRGTLRQVVGQPTSSSKSPKRKSNGPNELVITRDDLDEVRNLKKPSSVALHVVSAFIMLLTNEMVYEETPWKDLQIKLNWAKTNINQVDIEAPLSYEVHLAVEQIVNSELLNSERVANASKHLVSIMSWSKTVFEHKPAPLPSPKKRVQSPKKARKSPVKKTRKDEQVIIKEMLQAQAQQELEEAFALEEAADVSYTFKFDHF